MLSVNSCSPLSARPLPVPHRADSDTVSDAVLEMGQMVREKGASHPPTPPRKRTPLGGTDSASLYSSAYSDTVYSHVAVDPASGASCEADSVGKWGSCAIKVTHGVTFAPCGPSAGTSTAPAMTLDAASPPPYSLCYATVDGTVVLPFQEPPAGFESWEIDHTRFSLRGLIGKGSYGAVAEGMDRVRGTRVAVKRIKDVFESFETAKRIFRELALLRTLDHENIVKIVHVQMPTYVRGGREGGGDAARLFCTPLSHPPQPAVLWILP